MKFLIGVLVMGLISGCNMSAEISEAPTAPPPDSKRLNKSLGADFVSGSTSNYSESVLRGYKIQATAGAVFGEPESTSTLRGYKIKASLNADANNF